jgi:hypothetical protein
MRQLIGSLSCTVDAQFMHMPLAVHWVAAHGGEGANSGRTVAAASTSVTTKCQTFGKRSPWPGTDALWLQSPAAGQESCALVYRVRPVTLESRGPLRHCAAPSIGPRILRLVGARLRRSAATEASVGGLCVHPLMIASSVMLCVSFFRLLTAKYGYPRLRQLCVLAPAALCTGARARRLYKLASNRDRESLHSMSVTFSVSGDIVSVAGAAPVSEKQLQRSSLLARLRESDGSADLPLYAKAFINWQKVVDTELDASGLSTEDACGLLEARSPTFHWQLPRSHDPAARLKVLSWPRVGAVQQSCMLVRIATCQILCICSTRIRGPNGVVSIGSRLPRRV